MTTEHRPKRRPAILGGKPALTSQLRLCEPTLPPLWRILPGLLSMWRSRWLANHGPHARAFAEAVALALAGSSPHAERQLHVVPTNNGTSALIAALRALGVGGEVVVPTITFPATAQAVAWSGAQPVLCDVRADTWCAACEEIEARITARTEAIVPVHLFGNPCGAEALEKLAHANGLALLFDAAHAFGSRYSETRSVGVAGDAEAFSFHATKIVAGGEGGAVATHDPGLAKRCTAVLSHGDPGSGVAEALGLNGRMPEFAALLAKLGLPALERNMQRRGALVSHYRKSLAELPGITWQKTPPNATLNHQYLPLHLDAETFGLTASGLAIALGAENIEARRYFAPPLHQHPAFEKWASGPLPISEWLTSGILCLPLYSHMTQRDVEAVCGAIWAIQRHRGEIRSQLSSQLEPH